MEFTLDLPTGPLADAILDLVQRTEAPEIAKHSVRAFFFAQLIAEREGLKCDRDLLYAATVLHDLGTGDRAAGAARFEVEGADLAAELLREYDVDEPDVDQVWEAIALHTSAGIAERRGVLAYLTRAGVGADFGLGPETGREQQIQGAYPREGMATALVDAIVEKAARSAAAGAPYTFPGELLRERRTAGTTRLEQTSPSRGDRFPPASPSRGIRLPYAAEIHDSTEGSGGGGQAT
jgi:hypothetical protein